MTDKGSKKRRIIRSWILPLLLLFVVAYPDTRVMLMRGLMKIGLFKPSVSEPSSSNTEDYSAAVFMDDKGTTFTLGSLKGKVVLINFWAIWCPPCRAEMPSLQTVFEKWKNDPRFIFLAVDADGNLEKANAFLKKNDYSFPAYAQAAALPQGMAGNTLPETIVIDKTGRLAFRHTGMANYASDSFLELIEGLVEK